MPWCAGETNIAHQHSRDNLVVAAKGPDVRYAMWPVCEALEKVWKLRVVCPCRSADSESVCTGACMTRSLTAMGVTVCGQSGRRHVCGGLDASGCFVSLPCQCRALVMVCVVVLARTLWDPQCTVARVSFISQRLPQDVSFSINDLWGWLRRHAMWRRGMFASWHVPHAGDCSEWCGD